MTLKATEVSKRFKTIWALRDVTFEANAGLILGIFGPAASGRSTLLRILAGRVPLTSGKVELDGEPVNSSPQSLVYLVEHKVGGIVDLLRVRRRSCKDEVRKSLYSDARLVLLDEPFAQLDHFQRPALVEEMRRHARGPGRYVVVATSNFDDVLALCDEVIVLDKGELLQFGTPAEVYVAPETAWVAQLTGRVNLFQARRLSSATAEVPEFQTLEGSHRLTTAKPAKSRLGALNQNVTLAIRPEHISISFGASFPADNLLKAKIVSVRFLGPNTLVDCDAGGLAVSALVMRLVGLAAGDECLLGLPPERISVYR